MSLRAGLTAGLLRGPRLRPQAVAAVNQDGPNGWYIPQSSADFATLGLAAPDYLWLCQESSGDLNSTIGSLTLTANATGHLYQKTIAGWQQKFVGLDHTTAGQSFRTTSASLNLASGESFAMIGLCSYATATGFPAVISIAQTANGFLVDSTGKLYTQHGGSSTLGTKSHSNTNNVHFLCWYRNAATDQSGAVTDLEAWSGVHDESALNGLVKSIGSGDTSVSPAMRCGWFAMWKGSNAERNWSTYVQTLRGL